MAETQVAGSLPSKLFISCFLGSLYPIIQAEPLQIWDFWDKFLIVKTLQKLNKNSNRIKFKVFLLSFFWFSVRVVHFVPLVSWNSLLRPGSVRLCLPGCRDLKAFTIMLFLKNNIFTIKIRVCLKHKCIFQAELLEILMNLVKQFLLQNLPRKTFSGGGQLQGPTSTFFSMTPTATLQYQRKLQPL